MRCERKINDRPCPNPAAVFVMGQHACLPHDPKGDASCSHSLAPSGRCAYCGAVTP